MAGAFTSQAGQGAPPNRGWTIFKRNKPAMVSLAFLCLMVLASFIGPWLLDERLADMSEKYLAPGQMGTHGLVHWFGTNLSGHDVLWRCLAGARVSIFVGIAGALISLVIGVLYGVVSGYAGGRIDGLMMRLLDGLYAIPRLLFIMIFVAAFDRPLNEALNTLRLWAEGIESERLVHWTTSMLPYSRILLIVISLGFIEWLTMARIVRGQTLALKQQLFVTATRAMGQSHWKVIRLHLLPNLSSVILTYLTLTIPAVILDESFLSFLGLGIDDPAASWGSLLKEGASVINPIDQKWWLLAFPALFMASTLLALNFVGDGLRESFDPKSS